MSKAWLSWGRGGGREDGGALGGSRALPVRSGPLRWSWEAPGTGGWGLAGLGVGVRGVPGKRSGDECCVLSYLGHGWTEPVSSSSPPASRHPLPTTRPPPGPRPRPPACPARSTDTCSRPSRPAHAGAYSATARGTWGDPLRPVVNSQGDSSGTHRQEGTSPPRESALRTQLGR